MNENQPEMIEDDYQLRLLWKIRIIEDFFRGMKKKVQ